MDFLLEALTNWLKEMLVGGIMSNLSGMFDSVNQQVADISVQVGQTPQGWNGSIFNMIENLSNSIMVSEGRKRLSDEVQLANDAKQWVEAIQEYANITELDAATLNRLIKEIVVHERIDEDKTRHISIEIHFNLKPIRLTLDQLLQNRFAVVEKLFVFDIV